MSKPTTHVLLLVDDSASMQRVAESVRSGFNEYIDSLIADTDAKYRVTVGIFGSEYKNLAVAEKPKNVLKLDKFTYQANQGSTSLYDSLARLIREFAKSNGKLAADDKVLLVIQTDGQDNSSREVDLDAARALIEQAQNDPAWNVLFLGAGLSGWRAGSALGISDDNLYRTDHSAAGYESSYRGVTVASTLTSRGVDRKGVAEATRGAINND